MNEPKIPVACELTDFDFQQRRQQIVKTIASAVIQTVEVKNGYRYRFPSTADWITQLAELITVERKCCPFLQFDLSLEPDNGPIWLELTGPEGTKDFLRSLFPWIRASLSIPPAS